MSSKFKFQVYIYMGAGIWKKTDLTENSNQSKRQQNW
jgi:hypothetical protein